MGAWLVRPFNSWPSPVYAGTRCSTACAQVLASLPLAIQPPRDRSGSVTIQDPGLQYNSKQPRRIGDQPWPRDFNTLQTVQHPYTWHSAHLDPKHDVHLCPIAETMSATLSPPALRRHVSAPCAAGRIGCPRQPLMAQHLSRRGALLWNEVQHRPQELRQCPGLRSRKAKVSLTLP